MFIKVNDYNIHYNDVGNGEENIIILQGWGTTLEVYNSLASLLSSRYRVIQLDLPGFGLSDEPKVAWTVQEYVLFFLDFLKELNISRVTLIGHSYGGRMIIKLAGQNQVPICINRIVLIDSAGVLPPKTFKKSIRIAKYKLLKKVYNFKPINHIFNQRIEKWKQKQGSEDYRNASPVMRQCLVKAVNEDLTPCMPNIKPDTLLIWGENDTAAPLADAKKWRN